MRKSGWRTMKPMSMATECEGSRVGGPGVRGMAGWIYGGGARQDPANKANKPKTRTRSKRSKTKLVAVGARLNDVQPIRLRKCHLLTCGSPSFSFLCSYAPMLLSSASSPYAPPIAHSLAATHPILPCGGAPSPSQPSPQLLDASAVAFAFASPPTPSLSKPRPAPNLAMTTCPCCHQVKTQLYCSRCLREGCVSVLV
jgi:hypothetical protein